MKEITEYHYDWWKFDKDLMRDFNWFLYKVNQRACINLGYDASTYEGINRNGEVDHGLGINVEYFHPTITLDDRMRFIAENISTADMSLFNIVGNTFISHFYSARGVHQLLTQSNDLKKCYVDFDRIADNDKEYIQLIRSNLDLAKRMKQPIWGTTELHTSIQASGRNSVMPNNSRISTFDLSKKNKYNTDNLIDMYRPGIYVSIGGGPEDNIKMNLRQIESQIDKILPSILHDLDYEEVIFDNTRGDRKYDDNIDIHDYTFKILLKL